LKDILGILKRILEFVRSFIQKYPLEIDCRIERVKKQEIGKKQVKSFEERYCGCKLENLRRMLNLKFRKLKLIISSLWAVCPLLIFIHPILVMFSALKKFTFEFSP
jgi:hypothetical protein